MFDHDLFKIVYCSRATKLPSSTELNALLIQARNFNSANGITGILLYKDGSYLQYIEGEQEVINQLYTSIKRDQRHYNVKTLVSGKIEQRVFHNWHMGFYEPSLNSIKISDDENSNPLHDLDKKVFESASPNFDITSVHQIIGTFLKYA